MKGAHDMDKFEHLKPFDGGVTETKRHECETCGKNPPWSGVSTSKHVKQDRNNVSFGRYISMALVQSSSQVNANAGRDISGIAKKEGVQMFKLAISTEKINNANEFKFIRHDTFDVNTEPALHKNLISK